MTALGTRSLKIKVGTTEYTATVSRVEITSAAADSDFVSFADAATGGAREYALEFTAVQDLETTTLWNYVWANPGTTVAVKVNPYGVATATATQPIYTGNVTIAEPDGTLVGGEANSSTTAKMTFDCRWVFTAKPTKDTAGAF
jgi:hypothetical protein